MILLLILIVILLTGVGLTMFDQTYEKESTEIQITSNSTQNESGTLTLKLTDLNKTSLSKQKINITVTDKKGKIVINKTVKTNSNGNAKLDLNLKKGNYTVNAFYSGNDNYTGNHTTQKLTVNEKVQSETVDYPEYSSVIGNYVIVETQEELELLETSDGNYYVMGDDGIYTYDGRDSDGMIILGTFVGI